MRRLITFALLAAALAAAGWYGWTRYRGATETAAAPATTEVRRDDIARNVLASGMIEAAQLVSVGARVSGQVQTLAVGLGDRVEAGQLVAQIDSEDQRNAVLQAESALKQAEAQIAAKRAGITEAELGVRRKQTLNDKSLTSTEDLESAQAALAVAEAELQSLEAARDQAVIALSSARTELERTRIVSPIAGTVVAVVTEQGQTVNANTQSPTIVKIAQLDRMVVKAEISEADVIALAPGLPVTFTLAGAPDRRFDATLRAIAPAPASIKTEDDVPTDEAVYYNALLDVANPDGILRIGMTAEVVIQLDRAEKALVVPVSALARDEAGNTIVYVWNDGAGQAEPRVVTVGLRTSSRAEILDGLAEGDRIVTSARDRPASAAPQRRPGMMGF
ncbi:MAG: efflux RND transporter periplasmic adaptor subunit [Pseudomonadota bacterium]